VTPPPHSPPHEALPSLGDIFHKQIGGHRQGTLAEANLDRDRAIDRLTAVAGLMLCHTRILKSRTEASIRLPRMFNHTHSNNMTNRWNVSIKQSNIPYIMTQGSEKDYRAENSRIRLSIAQLPQA
jgi:hypothetical protein